MKEYFDASVQGKTFLKTYLLFFIPILILSAIGSGMKNAEFAANILSLVESYLSMMLQFAFFCYLITTVVFRNTGFPFSGTTGDFAPKAALWYVLTVITLGIYGPWFLKNYINYILDRISWDGKSMEHLSRPGRLLGLAALLLLLPLVAIGAVIGLSLASGISRIATDRIVLLSAVFTVLIFLVMLPFIYYYLTWLINFRFAGYSIRFQAPSRDVILFLLGQVLLSLATFFIYYPAAWIKINRYIASKITFFDENDIAAGNAGFDGATGEGFGLLWGQILLTLITIGFYGPWAMAKICNWFIGHCYLEGELVF